VGLDDTDSPAGGCTTHFALETAAEFRRTHGLVLSAPPRLVRLNPNVPWKTRGNAAVSLEFGSARGSGRAQGGVALDGMEIVVDPTATRAEASRAHCETLDGLIEKWCDLGAAGTDPAYVLADVRPPPEIYERAVRGIVNPKDVVRTLRTMRPPPLFKALGDGRGIVGAAAAAAFTSTDPTFELIVYRERERWGTTRRVDLASVDAMDRAFPTTYHNIDRANGHAAVAPSTPCPVLFGVRAFSPDELRQAAGSLSAGEPWGGWMLFETNQGTDAHVMDSTAAMAPPLCTVRVEGKLTASPRRVKGGHVIFELEGPDGGKLDCAAYEPTKQFRGVVGALEKGDLVRVVGAVREDRRTLNLEKLEVIALAPRTARGTSPPCPSCGRTMKSSGKGAPYRCASCGAKLPKAAARASVEAPAPKPGWYEVPICARRHLARPIDPHGY